jgi:hypothetical protein
MNLLNVLLNVEGTLKLIDQYGVGLVALVIVCIFSWILVKFILKRLTNQEEKIDNLVDKLINNDTPLTDEKMGKFALNANRVQQLIYHLLNEFDADRISVYEFHNGGKTITGINFKKCSNTYEAVGLNIEEKNKGQQNLPISVNYLWNKLLIDKKPINITNISLLKETDKTIYQTLNMQKIKSYYARLINDYNGNPIGFIIIKFYDKNIILNEKQIKIFNDTTICIGGLINKD